MEQKAVITTEKKAALYASEASKWITSDTSIKVPEGYDMGNEVASALLYIAQNVKDKNSKSALDVCTKESILSSIRDMCIQGLSVTRNQVYPIVYGNKLSMQRSYFGTMTALQRLMSRQGRNIRINADVIYEGDEYSISYDDLNGYSYITGVKTKIENRRRPIVAAYGSIIDVDKKERIYATFMDITEIRTAWSHAKTDKVQKEFPQEMAKRTLINRMCKLFINTLTSSGDVQFREAFNRMSDEEYSEEKLENVTPPTEKEKAIRERSQGAKGLESLLKAEAPKETPHETHEKAPKTKAEPEPEEITPPQEDEEPQGLFDEAGEIPEEEFDHIAF